MYEKITLDNLTEYGVSVKTQKYIEQDGIEYPLGEPHRKAYSNSEHGRNEILELPENTKKAILIVWENTLTVSN